MSLKPLIKNQTLTIDDHGWGAGEVKSWDDPTKDVHIDKKTRSKYQGKNVDVRIKIPINSMREIIITAGKSGIGDIPRELKREISEALRNSKIRRAFIEDIVKVLENYQTNLDSRQRAGGVLNKISEHFGLAWTDQEIANYIRESLVELRRLYRDEERKLYYITMDRNKIEIGELTQWDKWRMKVEK